MDMMRDGGSDLAWLKNAGMTWGRLGKKKTRVKYSKHIKKFIQQYALITGREGKKSLLQNMHNARGLGN